MKPHDKETSSHQVLFVSAHPVKRKLILTRSQNVLSLSPLKFHSVFIQHLKMSHSLHSLTQTQFFSS